MVEIRRPKRRYEAHRKEFAAARGLETSQASGIPAGTLADPAAKAPGAAAPAAPALAPAPNPRRAAHADEKLRLKFTLHAPLPGTFDYFDQAVALMGDGKALRLVLARAFDELEAAVAAGETVPRTSYPVDPAQTTNTSRHVSAELYANAKAALDPMDLLPPGTLARELAMAALARWLREAS